jgi:transcriptional regulator with XRE-family HTH domain
MDQHELAVCLRSWRDRLQPADVGLPAGGTRRAPGLRREEVAHLAGLSVDYLARLEQGRATSPSASVLAPLARALRLTDEERAHLFRVAGHAEPDAGGMRRHLTPSIQRVLDRLADVPVLVVDVAWEVVAANPLATALLGDVSGKTPRERNILWRHFTATPSRVVRTAEETARFEAEVVADLHEAVGRYPDDEPLRTLVDDLRRVSPHFAERWEQRPIARHRASRKTLLHPEVGTITLDCDVLTVGSSDLRLIVYTAPAGSSDAQALALLGAVGLQSFSDQSGSSPRVSHHSSP